MFHISYISQRDFSTTPIFQTARTLLNRENVACCMYLTNIVYHMQNTTNFSLSRSHNTKMFYIKLHAKFQGIYLQIASELFKVLNQNLIS